MYKTLAEIIASKNILDPFCRNIEYFDHKFLVIALNKILPLIQWETNYTHYLKYCPEDILYFFDSKVLSHTEE